MREYNRTMMSSNKKGQEQMQASNRILQGTKIEGNISSEGDFRIDGTVVGVITASGKVVIGENGLVEGEVYCTSATISGSLKGKAEIKELMQLTASSKVNGDIHTGKLSVEAGAEFTGSCAMGSVVRDLKSEEKSAKVG